MNHSFNGICGDDYGCLDYETHAIDNLRSL